MPIYEFIAIIDFYSRTSYEVRLHGKGRKDRIVSISTHAPLTRCDRKKMSKLAGYFNFYSRTSYEVRQSCIY